MAIKKYVIAGDIHLPSHCPLAVSTMLNFTKAFKPDGFIVNGDLNDFKDISRHSDASAAGRILDEVMMTKRFLADLRKAVGHKCKIHINLGNHDIRIRTFIAKNAPQLEGFLELHEMLDLDKKGITWMDYKPDEMYWLSDKLAVIHGFTHGTHHAQATLNKVGVSVITSHHHRVQTFTAPTVNRKGQSVRACYGIGCLVPLRNIPYMTGPSGWTNGFGIALVDDKTGHFSVHQLNMVENKLIAPDGKVYGPTGKGWLGK